MWPKKICTIDMSAIACYPIHRYYLRWSYSPNSDKLTMCGSSAILKLSVIVPSLQLSRQGGLIAARGNPLCLNQNLSEFKTKKKKKKGTASYCLYVCYFLMLVHCLSWKWCHLKEAEGEKPVIPFLWCSVLHILEPNVDQVALVVKNLPASAEDLRNLVWSLGWEDPLEEGMATHSSILTWRIPESEKSGGLQSIGSQWVGQD